MADPMVQTKVGLRADWTAEKMAGQMAEMMAEMRVHSREIHLAR